MGQIVAAGVAEVKTAAPGVTLRFPAVAGERGSADTVRDPKGFALEDPRLATPWILHREHTRILDQLTRQALCDKVDPA
jgi:hypothetical protein